MASMLEAMREYRHLAARRRAEGGLPAPLQARLEELETQLKAARASARLGLDEPRASGRFPAPLPTTSAPAPPRPRSRAASQALFEPGSARVSGAFPVASPGAPPPAPALRGASSAGSGTWPVEGPASGIGAARRRPSQVSRREEMPRSGPARSDLDKTIDPLWSRFEIWLPDPRHQLGAVFIGSGLSLGAAFLVPLAVGVPLVTVSGRLVPPAVLLGLVSWAIVYPGFVAAWEYASRKSRAHLSEPDFVVRVPLVEPLVFALGSLAGAAWILTSGLAEEGVATAVGAIACCEATLGALGLGAAFLVRPLSARAARARAYRQYVEGSTASLAKNNPRRARRLLERALAIAVDRQRIADLEERYERAVLAEAEQLRHRGLDDQADALVAALTHRGDPRPGRSKRRPEVAAPRPPRREALPKRPGPASMTEVVPRRTSPPRLLPLDTVRIADDDAAPPRDPSLRTVFDRAKALAAKDLAREALEVLVQAGLPVPAQLCREAAQQYSAQGVLRSAFVLYELLGEEQIPEFYTAAAVEWARDLSEGDRLAYGERLLQALEQRGDFRSVARLASQVVLESGSDSGLGRPLSIRALRSFERLKEPPPPELVEASGDLAGAVLAYEAEGRLEDARRCLTLRADRMLEAVARPVELIPVLSKLFHLDPGMKDEHLSPLVDHVIETLATGPLALRILSSWRSRHPGDERAAFRLFHLLLAAERVDDALSELTRIAARHGSQPASLVEDFRRLVESFPDHLGAREGLARTLVRAGRSREAAEELAVLLGQGVVDLPRARRASLRELIGSLKEWGHTDRELDRYDGLLAHSLGDEKAALAAWEAYVEAGGRDPEVVARARGLWESRLVKQDGGPSFEAHASLARFLLSAGAAEDARPYLEVLRGSPSYADEAVILLARVQLGSSSPERALQLLAGALGGRRPSDAPELYFELARAYAALGDDDRAAQVDEALERARPGFAAEYSGRRPRVVHADTALLSGDGLGPDTDVGGQFEEQTIEESALGLQVALRSESGSARPARRPSKAASPSLLPGRAASPSLPPSGAASPSLPPSATRSPSLVPSGGLAEALSPRYRLVRRLGSGGMGEVHLAEDLVLGREVAVKVLRRSLATDLFIAKFRDEARIVAQLSHPGIVGVFDIGQKGEWSYIVMEYVRGPNLATLVSASVPPPRSQILHYVASVAEAMAYAHRRGVVHRDLKPANILVGVDGAVKVTDFGIARVLAGKPGEETAFSAAGLQVGTVNYMAPEQLLEDRADARTDIYLLATTLYYCLCRKYPFSGESAAVQKIRQDAPRLSSRIAVSSALDDLVASGLSRKPEARPASMDALASALRAVPEASPTEDSTELADARS